MRPKARLTVAGLAASITGLLLAILISTAGADGTPAQTVVLGSVTGNPTASECQATVRCTYIGYNGIQFMVVPFDGTITSFSVNSGTMGGQVELRVLSSGTPPKDLNSQWTGAGTGPAETLKAGINTFAVDMPVQQGETIALDNDSGAPIFDNTSPAAQYASVAMYAPALPDGVTAYANRAQNGYSLLMSATVVSGTTTPTTTTTTTTTPQPPPVISRVYESNTSWREGLHPARTERRHTPVGTTFGFTLDQAATVDIELTHQIAGRSVRGACVAKNHRNSRAAVCARAVHEGDLIRAGHSGKNVVRFAGRVPRGRRLAPGRHVAGIIARDTAGQATSPVGLAFTILPG